MNAVAVRISKENLSAIASEAGRKLTREEVQLWIDEDRSGYFLRDDTSIFDCQLMADSVFLEIYTFKYPNDESSLFRPVLKL